MKESIMPDRDLLINALANEYEHLCHDCADEDDMTREEYIVSLNACTYTELIAETSTDDTFYQFEQWFEHWDY
jgi:hypothetical protein